VRAGSFRLLASLARNVIAGFRLGLFLPVARGDFQTGPAEFALLAAFNIAVAIAGSAFRLDFAGSFNPDALLTMLAGVTLMLLVCLVLSRLLRDDALFPAFAVMLASTDLLLEVSGSLIWFALDGEWLPAGSWLPPVVYGAYVAWAAASSLRAQRLLAPWRSRGSWPAALLLVATVLAFAYVPRDGPWVMDGEDVDQPADVLQEDFYRVSRRGSQGEFPRCVPGPAASRGAGLARANSPAPVAKGCAASS
jgi:hypothetical protein